MECLIENTPLWIRVTVLSFLLTNIRGIYDDGWWWWVGWKWDLLPVGWGGWMMGGWREKGPPFELKGEVFLLVWTPTETFMLVGVWTMSSDWSGYEGWTMYPDWSELNHAFWLVRTWWLKISELNRELWLVRTLWLKTVSWTVSCDWSELEDWKYVSWTMSCDWS